MTQTSKLEDVKIAIQAGNTEVALELLKHELGSNPQNVEAMLLVAQIVDDPKSKEKWYRFALRTDPQNSQALQGLKALSDQSAPAAPQPASRPPSPVPQQPPVPVVNNDPPPPSGVKAPFSPSAPASAQRVPGWVWIAAVWIVLIIGFVFPLFPGIFPLIAGLLIQLATLAWAAFWAYSKQHQKQGLPLLIAWSLIQVISLLAALFVLVKQLSA